MLFYSNRFLGVFFFRAFLGGHYQSDIVLSPSWRYGLFHKKRERTQMSTNLERKNLRHNAINVKSAFALVFVISMLLAISVPGTGAVQGPDTPTFAFLNVAPNPVGVNQPATVVMWLANIPLFYNASTGSVTGNSQVILFEGYSVTITKPDGSQETLGPYSSDPIASYYLQYVPTVIGKYTFQFHYPGQHVVGYTTTNTLIDSHYLPSDSAEVTLTVQEQPIGGISDVPVPGPDDYWSRPINGENRNWYTISGNWLGTPDSAWFAYNATGPFNPFTTAPDTGHIVWTTQLSSGGLVGGQYGDRSYYTGLSYEERFLPPVIADGRLYYNLPLNNNRQSGGCVCQDLRTGEILWANNITISFGQIYDYESPNQHGVMPLYLWNTAGPMNTWQMFDGFSGTLMLSFNNVSGGGKIVTSDVGDVLDYILDPANNWLAMWNSSKAIPTPGTEGTNAWQWRPDRFLGQTLDWRNGIQWNVSIAATPKGSSGNLAISRVGSGVILACELIANINPPVVMFVAYDDTTGQEIWAKNITSYTAYNAGVNVGPIIDGVFTWFEEETMETMGFNALTGDLLWTTQPKSNAWGVYSQSYLGAGPPNPTVAYGKIYSTGYDGIYCYDQETGNLDWTFSVPSGFETPYGNYPFYGGVTVADNKVFATTNDHSPDSPMWRGGAMYVLDAFTGKMLWNISGWYAASAVADGYVVVYNNYDSQIYCYGKGQTATTVSAPTLAASYGQPVLIQGTITDQSPGKTCIGVPAAGTPAISDDCMSAWMEYLYMQKPKPTDATGVSVHLTAIDSNGNTQDLGNVTSDTLGNYATSWTPPVPGLYKVTATFEGSSSYYSSKAGTAFIVSETGAPAPIATPTATETATPTAPTPTPMQSVSPSPSEAPQPTSPMPTTTYLAIGAAVVIIVAAAAALFLRKKR
jgi:outer membrane protein assembly factor BamB